MKYEKKPETLEGDWDRFYLEYPDVYDRFALTSVSSVASLGEMFDLDGKCVVDVGSGTGRSTFELAKHARFVVGLEPWDPMREFSVRKAWSMGIQNVAFVNGIAEKLPFGDNSADHIVSVYSFPFWFVDAGQEGQALAKRFVADALRIVRAGGYIIIVGSAPSWDAGELTHILWSRADGAERVNGLMTEILGFERQDIFVVADYGSLQEAVETYGFIYGQRAIDYLIANNKSSIQWKLRIHYRKVESRSKGIWVLS